MAETINRLPKYLCTQTIDRTEYVPQPAQVPRSCAERMGQDSAPLLLRLSTSDRLRLDVAVAAGSEIYSWVGEDHFENRALADLVKQGAISTGSYSNFLTVIFTRDSANFSYTGDTEAGGRVLAEFEFHVPLERSEYVFGNRRQHVKTAFEGTFLVDPKTLDLVQLVVHTAQLPAEVGSCQATTTFDYGRVRLNDADFLLPTRVALQISNIDGSELRNSTVFSGCHQFLGQSTLTFGEPADERVTGGDRQARIQTQTIPPNLPFTLVLTQPIDSAVAAVGDRVTAKLSKPIRDRSFRVLVREGAAVTARIVKMRQFYEATTSLTVALNLETLEVGGRPRPFAASPIAPGQRFLKNARSSSGRIDLGFLDTLDDPAVGIFEFRGVKENYVVSSGLESNWVTVRP